MSIWQILIYAGLLLLVVNFVRKTFAARNIKNYGTDEAKRKLNDRSAIFLDVRTQSERNAGSIKGSLHIPLNQLSFRIEELTKFKDKEFICYCRSGNRSVSAAVLLNKKGFNASNLRSGFTGWN